MSLSTRQLWLKLLPLFVLLASLFRAEDAHAVTSVTLMGAIAPQATTTLDTVYAQNTVSLSFASGDHVTLSTCQDKGCPWAIDDDGLLTITRPNGSVVSVSLASFTQDKQHLDLTDKFQVGMNSVNIKLYDRYAPLRGLPRTLYLVTTSSAIAGGVPVVTLPQTASKSYSKYVSMSKDPVSTLTGTFMLMRNDVSIAGRGPTPSLTRYYDSGNTLNGPLGPGWVHSYMARLVQPEPSTQDLVMITSEGRADRFTHSGGNYSTPSGITTKLVKNGDGTYLATELDQSYMTFDDTGRLTKLVDRYGNTSNLTYNSSSQLETVSDPAGRGNLTFTYSSSTGLLTQVSDWMGRNVVYGYDSNNRLSSVTDRTGSTTTYGYSGATNLMTTVTDARSNVTVTNTYDAQSRVATQKDALGLTTGQQTTFAYVTNGDGTKTTTVTYPKTSAEPTWNHVEVDTYDTSGRITSRVSKPSSASASWITETYGYDANGFRTSYTDGRGNATLYCYDVGYNGAAIGSRGNLTRLIQPSPASGVARPTTLKQYDAKNNVTQEIPPRGVTSSSTTNCTTNLSSAINTNHATDYVYDAGQVFLLSETTKFTDPDSGLKTAVTKYEYTDSGNPGARTKMIPPRGNTTGTPDYTFAITNTYGSSGNEAGMLVSETSPTGDVTSYQHDAVGRLIGVVNPRGNVSGANPTDFTTQYVYDNENRQRFVKLPPPVSGGSQLVAETRYDAVGNKTSEIDANGQVTRFVYDNRDSLKEVHQTPNAWTDPSVEPTGKITTEYQYDSMGNLTRVTRAKGASTERVTEYVYDGLNRMTKETEYPTWPTTTTKLTRTFGFDKAGNQTSLVDALNKTTTYVFDALNRNTGITYGSTTTPNVTYGYDANGNRTSMVDGTGTTSYTYDEMNHLLTVATPGLNPVAYRYDLGGNRTKLIYPDSTAVNYTFDKANRLSTVVDWASRTTSYQYHADSNVSVVSHNNNTSNEYSYDNANRLIQVWNKYRGTETVTRDIYTLDAVGNKLVADKVLADVVDSPGPIDPDLQGTVTYVYDRLYRVTKETRVLPQPQNNEIWDYTYDAVGNRLSKKITDYDHPIINDTTNYVYDKADRLTQVTGDESESITIDANGNLTKRDGEARAYDQEDRLIQLDTGTFATKYTYDGDGKLKQIKKNTTTLDKFVYDVNRDLPVLLVDNGQKYVWGLTALYNVDNDFNDPHVYHFDGLGSVVAQTGPDESYPYVDPDIDVYEAYSAFGEQGYSNRDGEDRLKFTGEHEDPSTEYVYLRARYYDPVIGRFMSRDSYPGNTSAPLTLNRYSYVENNPVNATDPTGHATNKALRVYNMPAVPPGVDLEKNIREAKAWWHHIPIVGHLWFASKVWPQQEWDYKEKYPGFQDFGNLNYGATGTAAGFSPYELLVMAGIVQVAQNVGRTPEARTPSHGTPVLTYPFGDDFRDAGNTLGGIIFRR